MAEVNSDAAAVTDRISELSDSILHHILSTLDMKEVVKTSILSKRWKYLWVSVPTLNFNNYRMGMDKATRTTKMNEFTNFVNQVLFLRNSQDLSIQKFSLAGGRYKDTLQIQNWVSSAISLYTQELYLKEVKFRFTSILGHVKTLGLTCVRLDVPFDFPDKDLNLRLEIVENLVLENCGYSGIKRLKIDAPKLQYLIVDNDSVFYSIGWSASDLPDLVIHAPNLTSLKLKGYLFNDYDLGNLASLVTADFHNERVRRQYLNTEKFVTRLDKILRGICNTKSLTLSATAFQVFLDVPDVLKQACNSFHRLKFLMLTEWHKNGHSGAVGKLVEQFPCVETLILERTVETSHFEPDIEEGDWEVQLSFQGMLGHLKTIEIRNLEGCENGLKFLKFLLKSAMVLENITIEETKVLSVDKEEKLHEFTKKLQMLSMASSSVKIVLNVKAENMTDYHI